MTDEFHFGYQYDRCVSRGICSINPATASLLEVILLELKIVSYYGIKTAKNGIINKNIRNLILNTISILSSNYEISEYNFNIINGAFLQEIPKITEEYEKFCESENIQKHCLETDDALTSCIDLNDYIRLGEKEFNKRTKLFSLELRNLYKILFIIVKSLCVNILIFESYGGEANSEVFSVLEMFNLLNTPEKEKEELKNIIINLARKDSALMMKIRNIQEKEYGTPSEREVSFSTSKGKCVLVVGSNLKELEMILDKFEKTNIDIYTHDNMILAHIFPKFREYKNLKGQFGQGMENCLLDFSTFPGPIVITRHSLYNVENLYRGLLYTTDFAYSKGVIPVKNNDFTAIIDSALNSKGFKTGKKCKTEKFGFSYEEILSTVKKKADSKQYSKIFIIGTEGYTREEKEYFKSLLKHISDDILVISFVCCDSFENLICLNSSTDTHSVLKLSEEIINSFDLDISLFFPYCDRHIVSLILYLNSLKKIKIFIGKWNQTILNPNVLDGLKAEFGINEITNVKNDLSQITKNE